jgi:hypothetical protein
MALVAVLRGLEALEQPSRVTLVTTSRYVFRGLQYGLSEWRDNDFSWEHFGTVQPIRNADIWRRIDRTLTYHKVQCRWISQDQPEEPNNATTVPSTDETPRTVRVEQPHTSPLSPEAQKPSGESTYYRPSSSARMQSASIVSTPLSPSIAIVDAVNAIEEVDKNCHQESEQPTKDVPQSWNEPESFPSVEHRPSVKVSPPSTKSSWLVPLWMKRWISAGTKRLWDWILKMDAEVDGYIRCLFLMEPKKTKRSQ